MNKKEEKLILEEYKKISSFDFEILELNQAQKVFSLYTGENPDFIIKVGENYVGVELFMLCLDESKVDLSFDEKKYVNRMQKNAALPKKFNSIEKAQEMLKNNPRAFALTRQDDSADIIKERIKQKLTKIKHYVTSKNWLLAYADEDFNLGLVRNIFADKEEQSYKSFIEQIIASATGIEKVILFEPNSPKEKTLEFNV